MQEQLVSSQVNRQETRLVSVVAVVVFSVFLFSSRQFNQKDDMFFVVHVTTEIQRGKKKRMKGNLLVGKEVTQKQHHRSKKEVAVEPTHKPFCSACELTSGSLKSGEKERPKIDYI